MTTPKHVSGTICLAEAAAHLNQIAEYADMMATGKASYIGAIKRRAQAVLDILAAIQPDPEPVAQAWSVSKEDGEIVCRMPGDPEPGATENYAVLVSSAGTVSVEAAARVLLGQPYSVMDKAFAAMEAKQGEGEDRIMCAALRALAGDNGK